MDSAKRNSKRSGLRRSREAKELSLEEMGDIVGVSPASLSRYETGQVRPRASRIALLAEGYGLSVKTFKRKLREARRTYESNH